jgi:hypothetical protein
MKLSRDAWLGIGLVFILMLVTAAVTLQKAPITPYLSTSPGADGTLALKLWLEQLGYSVPDYTAATFSPPAGRGLILVLQPILPISDSDWATLDQQVSRGATLIIAGDNAQTQQAFQHFDVDVTLLDQQTAALTLQNPLPSSPYIQSTIPIQAQFAMLPHRAYFVTLLAVKDLPEVISFDQSQGRVILSATPYPFSNFGLKDPTTAALVLNLVALSSPGHWAWFDEWHHGIQKADTTIIGPDQWLRDTPLGRALLFVVGAVFVALLLQGRGFGRPVPLPREIKRRGPLEHVTAIANLNRRAGHRQAVQKQYHDRLKQQLARRYSLDPSLPDEDYVQALAQHNPALDQAGLRKVLIGLARRNLSEDQVVELAARAAQWMQDGK